MYMYIYTHTHRTEYIRTKLPYLERTYIYIVIDASAKHAFPTVTTPEIQEDLLVFLKPED
jgi:hypothetical protein